MKAVLDEVLPQFERANRLRLATEFGTAASIKQRIEKGEAFDVVIVTSEAVDDLIKAGKVARVTANRSRPIGHRRRHSQRRAKTRHPYS